MPSKSKRTTRKTGNFSKRTTTITVGHGTTTSNSTKTPGGRFRRTTSFNSKTGKRRTTLTQHLGGGWTIRSSKTSGGSTYKPSKSYKKSSWLPKRMGFSWFPTSTKKSYRYSEYDSEPETEEEFELRMAHQKKFHKWMLLIGCAIMPFSLVFGSIVLMLTIWFWLYRDYDSGFFKPIASIFLISIIVYLSREMPPINYFDYFKSHQEVNAAKDSSNSEKDSKKNIENYTLNNPDKANTKEKIELLEDKAQYHGDDPIVRLRLGLPPKE
jgi:hypothetical protein